MHGNTKFLVLMLFCLGHVSTMEYTVNGTLFYNVTGTINASVEYTRDILNPKSHSHKEITANLTRGFLKLFQVKTRFDYNVTITEIFIWPSKLQVEINEETHKNLTFVMIARNEFVATPPDKKIAEDFVRNYFWEQIYYMQEDKYIVLEGLKIYESTLAIQEITEDEVNRTVLVYYNYVAFITKLYNGNDDSELNEKEENGVILVIAYVGIALSVTGLLSTFCSICYFRGLRKFRGNQILGHICVTVMAGMLLSVVAFTQKGTKEACIPIAVTLHFFILAALSWMCVDAYNLYRDLVKVFNTEILSNRAFFIRACVFAYGMPGVIVSVVSLVDVNAYGQRNDACWMTPLVFLVSFLAPVLFIVFVNIAFFTLIMREIVQVSQRDAHSLKPSLHAAVSLSVLLGFSWLLAGISTFYPHSFFQHAFVITSSFQGFFIFIFHGIGKKELRDSWKSLGIFQWTFYTSTSTDCNAPAKTEFTQDALQVVIRPSAIEAELINTGNQEVPTGIESQDSVACTIGGLTPKVAMKSLESDLYDVSPIRNKWLSAQKTSESEEEMFGGRFTVINIPNARVNVLNENPG